MGNGWRKEFEELDKKYQNEIKKLQEELKATMEQNKLTCQKLIREKDYANNDNSKREVMKLVNFGTEYVHHRYERDDDMPTYKQGSGTETDEYEKKESETNKNIIEVKANKEKERINRSIVRKEFQNTIYQDISTEENNRYVDNGDKLNHRKSIREEINKVTVDRRNREEQKSDRFDQSFSPKKKDIFSDTFKNIQGELSKSKSITRQQSIHDFGPSNKQFLAHDIDQQNNTEDQANLRSKIVQDMYGNDNINGTNDIDLEPVKIKKYEQGNISVQNNQKKYIDNKEKSENETFRKPISESNESDGSRIANYQSFLEYLNKNDEITKQQIDTVFNSKAKPKLDKIQKHFFADMDSNIFDFMSDKNKKNGVFFNDDFKRCVSQLVTVDSNNVENVFDETFRINDKPFNDSCEKIQKILNGSDTGKTNGISNRKNHIEKLESLLNKLDNEKPLEHINVDVSEPRTPILDLNSQQLTEYLPFSNINDTCEGTTSSDNNQSKERRGDSTVHQQLKHSLKCFGDISKTKLIQQKPSKLLPSSSCENFDTVISITNPDSDFDHEVMDTSTSESSKSDNQAVETDPLRDDAFAEYKGGGQITVTRAEYEILAKDLSIIVEEPETEDSRSQSVVTEGKTAGAAMTPDLTSSSDGSSKYNNNYLLFIY